MKSIQTKIFLLILSCVLTAVAVISIGIFSIKKTLVSNSIQIMDLMCEGKVQEIDEKLGNIEQSVNTVYNFAVEQMGDIDQVFSDEESLEQYTNLVKMVSLNVAESTEGAVSVYYRYNPELTSPTAGFFFVKDTDTGIYEDFQVTDLSLYEKDDVPHVGWYYIPIENGEPIWTNPYYNENVDTDMISYVIPFYSGDTVVGVIGMDIDVDFFRESIDSVSIYKSGYAFLLNKEGDILYHKDYDGLISNERLDDRLENLRDAMGQSDQTEGVYDYEWQGKEKKLVVRKLQNGMFLAVSVPTEEINEPWSNVVVYIVVLASVILLILLVVTTYLVERIVKPLKQLTIATHRFAEGDFQVSIECDTKDEVGVLAQSFKQTADALHKYVGYVNKLAYIDVLTETKNKASYEEQITYLNQKIKEENAEFSITVMDINNLKQMNDVYGHEMGDMLIRDAADTMKNVFGHDRIFRIGGDEFVAVLAEAERESVSELLKKFERKMKEFNASDMKKYEPDLMIAYGMAMYDKNVDKTYADVFRRADARMYEKKKQQKMKKV